MFKKIFIMLIVLLIGLAIAWGVMNYEKVSEKATIVKTKITEAVSKIPLIGKLFKAKEKEDEEKDEEEKPEEEEILEVKAFKVAQIHFTDILPSIGTIRGFRKINLRFEINGTISSFNFREGDLVEEGDIIAELDHKDTQLKVKFREAKLQAARTRMLASKKKLEQHQKLLDIGAIIKVKFEEVELEQQNAIEELKAAQIELESAKLELEKSYLRSPIDGVLESKDVETGEYVTSSIQVASLGDISEVFLELGIIEKDLERIELGQAIKLTVDTYPEEEFNGEIDNIFPTIEGKSRTLTVRARIPNPYNKLLPGMFARAWLTVYEKEDAIVVPPLSVDKTEEGYQVLTVDKDNVVQPKLIDIEYTKNEEYWVVAEGLEQGEIIVSEVVAGDRSQLKEGSQVEILETEEYTF